jgi:hypothetical protein
VMDDGRKCLQGAVCVRNVPEKHELWFNFNGDELGGIYPSKESADIWASERRTACIRVEWQDGEGLT